MGNGAGVRANRGIAARGVRGLLGRRRARALGVNTQISANVRRQRAGGGITARVGRAVGAEARRRARPRARVR